MNVIITIFIIAIIIIIIIIIIIDGLGSPTEGCHISRDDSFC